MTDAAEPLLYVPKFLEGDWHAVRLAPGTRDQWCSGGTAATFNGARDLCTQLNSEVRANNRSLQQDRKLRGMR